MRLFLWVFSLPIIRIILQKDGQWSGEPIHVSTLSGPRIPEQFCFRIHSGTFNVLLLGLQRKLKTFFPPSVSTAQTRDFVRHCSRRTGMPVPQRANVQMRSINISYALGHSSHLIYMFRLPHPLGFYTSLTTGSPEFCLAKSQNETVSPVGPRHWMTTSSDKFNHIVTSSMYMFHLSHSQRAKGTKAAITLLNNIYFGYDFGSFFFFSFLKLVSQFCACATNFKTF